MSTIWVTSEEGSMDNVTDPKLPSAFLLTVVKNMGLCVQMTENLQRVLMVNAAGRIAICLPGIVGAALSLWITCFRQSRSSVSVQVALLSLYDLIFLTSILLLGTLHLSGSVSRSVFGTCYVIRHVGLWGLTYTMVDITVERCISVTRPFLAYKLRRVSFTLKRSAVILGVGLAVTLPCAIDSIFGLSESPECRAGRSLTTYGVVYTLYVALLLFYLLPYTWILLANIRLIVALRGVAKRRRAMSMDNSNGTPGSTRQLSAFVMGLCLWYSVCMLAPSILFTVRLARIELFQPERDLTAAVAAETLVVLSTAANFLFYFLMWRDFRRSFLEAFCWRCRCMELESGAGSSQAAAVRRPLHIADSPCHENPCQPIFPQNNTTSTFPNGT